MTRPALIILFGGLILIFLVYFGFRLEHLWKGPRIAILIPEEGQFLKNTHVLVEGEGNNVARLELNGRPIYTDEDGFFEEKLILAPGLNYIQLKADGRFGKTLAEERMIMIKLPE